VTPNISKQVLNSIDAALAHDYESLCDKRDTCVRELPIGD